MTRNEARQLLDSMLPPVKIAGVNANKKLTATEVNELCDVVVAGENHRLEVGQNEQQYVNAVNVRIANEIPKVVTILKNHNYSSKVTMPYLAKQVLFYLASEYISANNLGNGSTQNDFLALLKANKLSVTHNFFTKLGYAPAYCSDMLNYTQPENPMPYLGQKKDELAVAIKNLVYQAGTRIECYVDLFGGSGSATTAVCPKKGWTFVYNEKDNTVTNLMEVLKDKELSQQLAKQLKGLVDDIEFGKPFIWDSNKNHILNSEVTTRCNMDGHYHIDFKFNSVNFAEEIQLYESYQDRRPTKQTGIEDLEGLYMHDTSLVRKSIIEEFDEQAYFNREYIESKVMVWYANDVASEKEDFVFEVDGEIYKKEDLLKYKGWDGFVKSISTTNVVLQLQ